MEDREILESALTRARQALAILESQAAGYTVLSIPPHLVIERDEKRKEVARLETRLTQLETGAVSGVRLPQNLPRRSEFVGREAYKAQVHAALRSRAYLVSIEGIGGIGKTSLALEVAYECLQASTGDLLRDDVALFEGFVWVTAQGQELTLNEVLDTIARTLDYPGITQRPPEEKRPAVCRLLQMKRYLLLVDNYETITDPAINEFLLDLPEPSKALITTREQKLSRVSAISLKSLEEAEALELLRSEGQRLSMTALLHVEDAVLLRLYKATGGAPLALKWAVGQIKQKGQSLDRVLEALYGARGDVFDQIFHRSWQLLSPEARQVLCVMPLFVHSASREAIEAASNIHHFALDEALGQLVEMSLVNATDELEITSRRYNVHPLVRAFGTARLQEGLLPEESTKLRLAEYYCQHSAKFGGWGQVEGYPWLEIELPNILVLIEWAYHVQEWKLVIAFYTSLYYFFGTRGYWQERIFYGELALAAAQQIHDQSAQALCYHTMGWIYTRQGQFAKARELLNQAIAEYAKLQDYENLAETLVSLTNQALVEGNLVLAQTLIQDAQEKVGEDAYQHEICGFLTVRAHIEWRSGRLETARELFLSALIETQRQGASLRVSSRQLELGNVALEMHNVTEAWSFFQQALEMSQQFARQDNIAKAKFGLARVLRLREQHEEAIRLAHEAREMFIRLEARQSLAEVDVFLQAQVNTAGPAAARDEMALTSISEC